MQVFVRCSEVPLRACGSSYEPVVRPFDRG